MKKILLYLVALAVGFHAKAAVTDYQNWMAGLDDDAFICQLSIPGAHDACCSSFSGLSAIGAAFAGKVQTKSVEQMLALGVRAFDLRPAVIDGKLTVCHGVLVTSFDFNTILQQLCAYLDAHPSEFCVVSSRHEVEADDGDSSFGSKLQSILASIQNHLVNFRPNLTVGEARGKILFLSRDAYDEPMYGGRFADLRDNQSDINNMLGGHCYGPGSYKCPWWVQGYYDYSDVNAKKSAILAMLGKSCQLAGKYSYTWVENGPAGYKETGTNSACQANAKACNPYLQELLSSGGYNGPAGLIFMDYCCDGDNSGYYGLSLTKELVNHNFRYTMSKQGDPIYDDSGNLFVAPRGQEMMWEGKLLRKESTSQAGPSGWYRTDFDDSGWETVRFPVASEGTSSPYYSLWDGTNNSIFIRREFYIDHDPSIDTYKFYVRHDDDYKVYLNGTLIDSQTGWIGDYRTVGINSSRLCEGRNVLAIQVKQFSGGAFFDCGVCKIEEANSTINVTYQIYYNGVKVDEVTTEAITNKASALPPEKLNDFCTYTYSPSKVTSSTIRVTAKWKGPFTLSKDFEKAAWYNLRIGRLGRYVGWENREPYHPHAFDATSAEIGKDPETDRAVNIESELYATALVRASDAYQWAFVGDPYHIKVVNRQMGKDYALTVDGEAVPAYNRYHQITATIPMTVLRAGEGYTYDWEIKKNTLNDHANGFVLNLIATDKYINPHGSADGYFQVWDNSNAKSDENTQLTVEAVPTSEVTLTQMGDAYYTTLCLPYDVTVSGADVYTLATEDIANGNAHFKDASSTIAAGTPVLLKGSSDTALLTYGSGFTTTPLATTALTGLFMPANPNNALMLQLLNDTPGFYPSNGKDLHANSAYLTSDHAADGVAIQFEATGINDLIPQPSTLSPQPIYHPSGQRLSRLQRGVNILGNKKVIIK